MKIKSIVERYYCLEGEAYSIKTSYLFSCYVGHFLAFSFPEEACLVTIEYLFGNKSLSIRKVFKLHHKFFSSIFI